jgi:predicted TIM-barrel fold metal-dependent hydrolase
VLVCLLSASVISELEGVVVEQYRLISSDSHVTIPLSAWQEYLPANLGERAPYLERTEEGDYEVFEGQRKPIATIANLAGKKPEDFKLTVRKLEEQRSGAWDPSERLKDMDTDGVDAEVLYFGGPLAGASDSELRLASYPGYNRWLADYCSYAPKRLLGMGSVPVDTPELAAAEIKNIKELGLAGATVPLFPGEDDEYGHERWNILWDAYRETGLPVGLHVGGRRPGTPVKNIFESAPQFMTGLVMSKLTMAESISELIHGLVMQRYPDLKFIAVESQIGWMSFFQYYSDHLWEKHRFWTESELEEPPSHYFRRQVFGTFMEDPVGLRERHAIGIDNIMWASDYPHSETTWPHSKALTDEWFTPYGEDDKAKILWKNCATLFDLL